jgi:thiol-disulfide isomerase/thioredoxin
LIAGGTAALLVIFVIIILSGGGQSDQPEEAEITLLDGETVSLSDYRGQVVLINFWATWCPPCRAEMPTLDAYYREHRDNGLVLLAINAGETPAAARTFIDANGFTFPVGLDRDSSLSRQFGASGLPLTLVLDADGVVQYRHSGMITREALDEQVTPLLASE